MNFPVAVPIDSFRAQAEQVQQSSVESITVEGKGDNPCAPEDNVGRGSKRHLAISTTSSTMRALERITSLKM